MMKTIYSSLLSLLVIAASSIAADPSNEIWIPKSPREEIRPKAFTTDRDDAGVESALRISTGDSVAQHGRTFSAGFSSPTGTSFECRVHGAGAYDSGWEACRAPVRYDDLPDGAYSFQVRALESGEFTDVSATGSLRALRRTR